jgi:hypothetical protein
MKKYLIILIFVFAIFNANSQNSDTSSINTVPEINGLIKTKCEYDLDNRLVRFEVRNARLGAKGSINKEFSYRVEVDLSDEGKIKMLDAYSKFSPLKDLDFYLGQKKIPFGTDYLRNPIDELFANRSFVAKYVNDGLRDIGFVGSYKIRKFIIPTEIWADIMNGSGNNNPQWKKHPNYGGRLILGNPDEGISVKGNLYTGDTEHEISLLMYSGEIAFCKKNFLIETEFIQRTWADTLKTDFSSNGMYIHSYYTFRTKNKMIQYIMPTIRWDMMGNNILNSDVSAERITLGVNFGFSKKILNSEIRINYENYFKSSLPAHTDKITVEFDGRF